LSHRSSPIALNTEGWESRPPAEPIFLRESYLDLTLNNMNDYSKSGCGQILWQVAI
jgi:hypothetical protein